MVATSQTLNNWVTTLSLSATGTTNGSPTYMQLQSWDGMKALKQLRNYVASTEV